jgi:hypothetical protein
MSASSIANLPTDPAGGGSIAGNVQFSVSEQDKLINTMQASVNTNMGVPINNNPNGNSNSPIELSQSTIAELVSGIQKVAKQGSTSLPSRDIPMSESKVITDEEVKPNYIPSSETADYIKDYQHNDTILQNYETNAANVKNIEDIYDELQGPILAALLYFIFQLPSTKKYENKFIPGLFNTDGNMNLYGFIFNSCIVGVLLFIIKRLLNSV